MRTWRTDIRTPSIDPIGNPTGMSLLRAR